MKTAEIMRLSMGAGPVEKPWLVGITDHDGDDPGWSENSWHPTHTEALAHALAEVGLTRKEQS